MQAIEEEDCAACSGRRHGQAEQQEEPASTPYTLDEQSLVVFRAGVGYDVIKLGKVIAKMGAETVFGKGRSGAKVLPQMGADGHGDSIHFPGPMTTFEMPRE